MFTKYSLTKEKGIWCLWFSFCTQQRLSELGGQVLFAWTNIKVELENYSKKCIVCGLKYIKCLPFFIKQVIWVLTLKQVLIQCMHDIKLEKRMIMFLFKLIHNICHAHLFKWKVFFLFFNLLEQESGFVAHMIHHLCQNQMEECYNLFKNEKLFSSPRLQTNASLTGWWVLSWI